MALTKREQDEKLIKREKFENLGKKVVDASGKMSVRLRTVIGK